MDKSRRAGTVAPEEGEVKAGKYQFRVFAGPGVSTGRVLDRSARIQKTGEIHIPDTGTERIGNPGWVELLYDERKKVVGLRPTVATNPRAFPRRRDKKRKEFSIFAGRAFTRSCGIDTSVTRRYPWEVVDGVLVVDLTKGEDVTKRPPAPKKEADLEAMTDEITTQDSARI